MSHPASQEVALVAIIQPAEGKLERLRQILCEGIDWIAANEPDTLEHTLYEEHASPPSSTADGGSSSGVKLFMVERYASQAALTAHASTEHYTALIKTLHDEQLLAGNPAVAKGGRSYALRR